MALALNVKPPVPVPLLIVTPADGLIVPLVKSNIVLPLTLKVVQVIVLEKLFNVPSKYVAVLEQVKL